MRTPLTLAAVTAAVLLLAGCSGASSSDAASCKGAVASGSVSDSVKVTGASSKEPSVTFDKPLKATKAERTVVTKGKGQALTKGRTADVALVAYNGTTGKKLTSNGYGGTAAMPVTAGDASMIPGLTQLVQCSQAGERAVMTAPASSAFGQADPTALGLKKSDTIVFVADVRSIVAEKANGTPQKPQSGFPDVKLAANGKPTVTIPKDLTPPADTKVEVLKKGSGATIKDGDSVTVQYQGVNWRTGKVFDESWGRGAASFSTKGVVPGFSKALVGQKVGSQVVAMIPPKDGYGESGQPSAGIEGTDTLVFVIDILGTSH